MPSPVRPPRLPISVEVRSMDMTPAEARRSCFPGPTRSPSCLLVALDMADKLEARLLRPLGGPLGSLLLSMVLLQTDVLVLF
jgi:hypothetical protein